MKMERTDLMKKLLLKSLCLCLLLALSAGLFAACGEEKIDEGLLEPPEDFNISFCWGVGEKNSYDTYHNEITKDLVAAGTETRVLTVTKNDKAKIYTKLVELNMFSMPTDATAKNLATDGNEIFMIPLVTYNIVVTENGKMHHIKGDDTARKYPQVKWGADFVAFVDFMRDFVRNTPEYQAMPPAEGGYL